MGEIAFGKDKHVGDDVLVTELDDNTAVFGVPDYARDPTTGKQYKIITVVKTETVTFCPMCKEPNAPGVQITVLDGDILVYPCKICNKFVWFKFKTKSEGTNEDVCD